MPTSVHHAPDYDPKPSDLTAVAEADFVLYAPFEPFAAKIKEAAELATKRSILQRVRQVLSPQGFLFLGGAETTLGIDDGWTRSTVGGFTLYRPIAGGTHGTAPTLSPSLATSTGR